jgi:acyl-CoA synthetase (AMP-forming)/AMP-acid ligase II
MREDLSVFQAVAETAARFPENPALTGNGRTWTYRQLTEDAERLASVLRQAGCGPDAPVAVVSRNNPFTALVWLASARLGSIVSLINFMFGAQELGVVFQGLRPKLVFCDEAQIEVCREALARAGLETPCVLLGAAMSDGPRWEGPLPGPTDAHEISYTSGTTSAPKGAVLTHQAVLHRGFQEVELFGMGPDDAAIVVTPLFHQSGIRNTVLVMWLAGGHAVIAPKFEPAKFWAMVAQHRATYCCLVETMLLLLERQPVTEEERNNTLRRALGNGDPDVLERMEARFAMEFVTVYGMTENGVPVAMPMDLRGEELQTLRRWRHGAFLAGWPLPGTEIRLVNEDGVVAGEGVSGEIHIRSKNLFREYYRAPEATEAGFTAEGWFQTGDMGVYGPRGALYFVDRIKDVIRRGGENIASKEVEGVIAAHPGVVDVAVVPAPDPLFQQEVRAVVVAKAGAGLTADELWSWCEKRLARYKVPRYIEFRDALPVSGTGRVQKQVLRSEGVAGAGASHDRRQEAARA